ncbi:hypothetical protein [Hyphococcus luteus]|nr:hypothetical protein [Marinicaulis flavus]
MLKKAAFVAGSFFLFVSHAVAADALTVDAAQRFVESLHSVKALGDRLEAEGKAEQLQLDMQPKAGEPFAPYSKSVTALKAKYPDEYSELKSAVKPHGFSAEEWGVTGDQVMVAYFARKMEKENPGAMAQMEAMDPAMLEQMPPQMKEQIMQAKAMMETISKVPPENKEVVAEVEDDLDAYMEAEEAAQAGQ